ncbi:vesicle transport protein [Powellomyces hirtus]|nr:vesicle transport protein [Powellomyces hirtus]KAI8916985.1 vesicle transport protein [Powellomyces hirtus]
MLAQPPSHPHAEVNLRRLLARFEATISKPEDLQGDRLYRQKYHSNLAHLHKLLTNVETDPARRRDDTVLCEYRRRVEQLEAVLDTNRLLSSVGRTVASLRSLAVLSPTGDNADRVAAADRVLKLQRKAEDDMRDHLLDGVREPMTPVKPAPPVWATPSEQIQLQTLDEAREELLSTPKRDLRRRPNNSTKSHVDSPHSSSSLLTTPDHQMTEADHTALLERDRQLHEQMTEEIIQKAAQLKKSTMAMRDQLTKDAMIMDDASDQLNNNLTLVNSARKRLQQLNQTAKSTTWMVWITVFFVCIAFVFTFVIMRLFKPNATPARPPGEGGSSWWFL